ncbi:MAG: hypothetical protein Q7T70_09030 [Polaromonas sp.]|nr:hypothetical protein [Polaromonas sp.]
MNAVSVKRTLGGLALLVGVAISAGCTALKTCEDFKVTPSSDHGCVFAPLESTNTEADFRKWVQEPDWASLSANRIGVSLAGGGSKASAFGMGVLAGLDDIGYLGGKGENSTTPKVALVSSVSGGSYSAYYFFTQAVADHQLGIGVNDKQRTRYEHLFFDALSHPLKESSVFTANLLAALKEDHALGEDAISNAVYKTPGRDMINRRQSVVRCSQDLLLPGKCDRFTTTDDGARVWPSTASMMIPTLISLPGHHLANTLFDTGINLSPSRAIYARGIGMTYGSTPLDSYNGPLKNDTVAANSEIATEKNSPFFFPRVPCPVGASEGELAALPPDVHLLKTRQLGEEPRMINCRSINGQRFPRSLDFDELRKHVYTSGEQGKDELPFWVIQATGTKFRSLGGWMSTYARDPILDSFEITPLAFGSRRYGFVPGHIDNMSVLDAVGSSAAFLDANQQEFHKAWQAFPLGIGQHLFNLNWGTDIANYNVHSGRRYFHSALPLPIQWIDTVVANANRSEVEHDRHRSSFIRLLDGGGSENLGAIGPIRRGLKTVVIADSAQDSDGEFKDLCFLKFNLERLGPQEVRAFLGHPENVQGVFLNVPGLKGFNSHCEALYPPKERLTRRQDRTYYNLGVPTSFTTPALLGCITKNSDDGSCTKREDILTRLIVLKPMLDFQNVSNLLGDRNGTVNQCTVGRYLYSGSKGKVDCSAHPAVCIEALPCEVAQLMGNYKAPDMEDHFPQTGTVTTTGNSSSVLYASYRELARHQINLSKDAIASAAANTEKFEKEMSQQAGNDVGLHPRPCPAKKKNCPAKD